mmetsp:Transcript_21008/g.27149  ORF Transcript_21008/g.27149 Transcript_21008/m.27149 type:complete len:271 (-) Transcript_21008:633-1445(-)
MSVLLADIAIDLGEVDHFEFNDIWRILFKDIRNMGGAAWDLKGCCGPEESIFLAFYAGYGLIFFFINSWAVMKPMRLLSVFVHEFGHASACWLTGGKVKKIEVYDNEGGITGYSGGWKVCVIPAGYVGGAFWGGAFVAMSGSRIGATIVACLILFALFISLFHDPNKTVVFISIGFGILLLAVILIEWLWFHPFLEYVTLFFGVFIGVYSVKDIYDDLVTRTAEGSDAVACNQMWPCCLPRCVGVQFWLIAFAFQVLGLYIALVLMVSND